MLARMGFLTEISGPPVPADLSARWIFDRLEEWAEQSPNRLAFAIDRRDGVEEHRYADVLDHVNAIVLELQQHGIERGDKVGILMENIPQWVFVLLGAMRMGAVTVPHATRQPAGCCTALSQGERDDTAIIVYTSGTTGNPKGVELTFDNLNHEIRGAIELLEITPNHRILSVLPFSHVLPLIANALGP